MDDPRVYFAAERTLLAWVRTGLTVTGLGFVVARFGLFLRMIRQGSAAATHLDSVLIGVGLVLLGSAATGVAAWQFVRFLRTLRPEERPRLYSVQWAIGFAAALALVGLALAGHILNQSFGGRAD